VLRGLTVLLQLEARFGHFNWIGFLGTFCHLVMDREADEAVVGGENILDIKLVQTAVALPLQLGRHIQFQ